MSRSLSEGLRLLQPRGEPTRYFPDVVSTHCGRDVEYAVAAEVARERDRCVKIVEAVLAECRRDHDTEWQCLQILTEIREGEVQ
jgi:hypothetical protein